MLFIPVDEMEWWTTWEFQGPGHPCYLCDKPVGEGKTIMWSGEGCIFFHPLCVPSFCRRLLEDFERAMGQSVAVDIYKAARRSGDVQPG